MEFPLLADIEKQLADYIYSISEMVADKVSTFGIDREKINFFRNLAPREFTKLKYKNKSKKLNSVLVVSNHPPDEILMAKEILAQKEIKMELLGELDSANYRRMRPKDIEDYDAIITIGKTVQYALVAGIPCFVYDHFGGTGWVDSIDKIELGGKDHFSGRNNGIVWSSDKIVKELISGFDGALSFNKDYNKILKKKYSLKLFIDEFLNLAKSSHKTISSAQANILKNYCELQRGMYRTIRYLEDKNKF